MINEIEVILIQYDCGVWPEGKRKECAEAIYKILSPFNVPVRVPSVERIEKIVADEIFKHNADDSN